MLRRNLPIGGHLHRGGPHAHRDGGQAGRDQTGGRAKATAWPIRGAPDGPDQNVATSPDAQHDRVVAALVRVHHELQVRLQHEERREARPGT